MKILYFDVETTGLDPVKNDIIQLAGMIEIDGELKEEFEFKVAPLPENIQYVSQEALDTHGYSLDAIRQFTPANIIYRQLTALFDKYIAKYDKSDKFYPAGYNVDFDLKFLREFYLKQNDKYFGSYVNSFHQMDPLNILKFMHAMGLVNYPDYKLSTIAMAQGIGLQAHDAMSDIKATRFIIKRLERYFINVEKAGE
jgi:DNA polymerase III subunit epsilon